MVNIILSGAMGKMGQTICRLANASDDLKIVWGIDIRDDESSPFPITKTAPDDFNAADVLIDFSNPSLLENNLKYAIKNSIPALIATTGMDESHMALIKEASKRMSVKRRAL